MGDEGHDDLDGVRFLPPTSTVNPSSGVDAEQQTFPPWQGLLFGAIAFFLTPVVMTGMFRVLPDAIPGWVPPVALAVAAMGLRLVERVPRSVPIGIVAGRVVWTAFLYWLLARWDSMSAG